MKLIDIFDMIGRIGVATFMALVIANIYPPILSKANVFSGIALVVVTIFGLLYLCLNGLFIAPPKKVSA